MRTKRGSSPPPPPPPTHTLQSPLLLIQCTHNHCIFTKNPLMALELEAPWTVKTHLYLPNHAHPSFSIATGWLLRKWVWLQRVYSQPTQLAIEQEAEKTGAGFQEFPVGGDSLKFPCPLPFLNSMKPSAPHLTPQLMPVLISWT